MQRFVPVEALFKGRHFDGQIIILCVSWYASFKLSLRDLVIMMADRGVTLAHTTILRWIRHYLPEFEKRWSRHARPIGGSADEPARTFRIRGADSKNDRNDQDVGRKNKRFDRSPNRHRCPPINKVYFYGLLLPLLPRHEQTPAASDAENWRFRLFSGDPCYLVDSGVRSSPPQWK